MVSATLAQMFLNKQSPYMRLIVMIAILGLGACATFPELDGTIDATAKSTDYPTLLPLAPLLALSDRGTPQITAASLADFNTRLAALRARAALLRGPVIGTAIRARMQRGVAVPAAIR